jgi:arylsulfatase A-like enzyme/tetratricopeptide (TPR) repeat protein
MDSCKSGQVTRWRLSWGWCRLPALLLAIGCAAQLGCESASEPAGSGAVGGSETGPVTPQIGGKGINVLLVSVDTTRADHLGCYGHPDVKTPNIDRLAAEGARFTQCISSAPLTLPSHATMLTGSYPFVHGARDNGLFTLPQENQTLAEIFKAAGYATHAEVASVVLKHECGLQQGFDTYGDVPPTETHMNLKRFTPDPWDMEGEGQEPPAIEAERPKIESDRKAGEITDRGIELLTQRAASDEPFFMFLHYFDPHWPHEAPEPFASEYRDTYLAEIAYFDEQFGRLMDGLEELGFADNTFVILTSDHGEGRGQHGEFTHSTYLYDTTLHVPLLIRLPGQIPAGQVIETQVRLVDLAPTIVDCARLERTGQMQGESLLPLLVGPGQNPILPCYSDTMVPKNSLNYSPLRSLRADGWKYILAPRSELYHVAEDPGEVFNVVQAEPERSARMREELRDIIADAPPAPGGRAMYGAISADTARKLAALGYVSVTAIKDTEFNLGAELDHFEPVGINPRDRVEAIECWAAGLGAFRDGQFELAETTFRRFYELEPDVQAGASYLGRTLMMLDRNEDAIEWFRKAIEIDPQSFLDQRSLGNLLSMKSEYAEAEKCYRAAIEHNPGEESIARVNLGIVLATQQRYDEALVLFDEVIEMEPQEPAAYMHKGAALRLTGRVEESLEPLAEAIRLDPTFAGAHAQLAISRHQLGRRDEAVAGLQSAAEQMPDEPMFCYRLAQLAADRGDLDRAGEWLARLTELRPGSAAAWQMRGANACMRQEYATAVEQLQEALELNPDSPRALFPLATAHEALGEYDQAVQAYRRQIELSPKSPLAYTHAADILARLGDEAACIELLRQGATVLPERIDIANDLAWHLATTPDTSLRDGAEAVRLAEYASSLKGDESFNELDTLAAAYAETGRFDDAVSTAERALTVARQLNDPELVRQISVRLELFRQGKPYRVQ